MSTEQQTQEFLAAFLASGLDVTEVVPPWLIQGTEHLGFVYRHLLYSGGEWRYERRTVGNGWHWPVRAPDHEAACLILRAMQDRLDEVGVEVVIAYRAPLGFQVRRAGESLVQYDDGSVEWLHTDRPTTFYSRPLATLAAFLAVKGGAK